MYPDTSREAIVVYVFGVCPKIVQCDIRDIDKSSVGISSLAQVNVFSESNVLGE
jgi:hypothetical protein